MKKLPDNHISISRIHFSIPAYFLSVVLLAGCASHTRPLMPVPNLYSSEGAPELFTALPAELQTNRVDLLYVTDRAPATDDEGRLNYGYGRSHSAAFGSVIVAIEPEMAWDDLQRVSLERDRSTQLSLRLASIEEYGRFPETPQPVVLINDEAQPDPIMLENLNITEQLFQKEIRRRLALAPKPEILLFVHGYNNQFEYAAQTLAELWHFFGREHVPILYSWPAGKGGASGYIYDRESGEFTVYHLKNLLRSLAGISEVKKFHLIAHSRGTDVLSTAVRELALVARAEREKAPDKLQVSHLILAAPDLDLDVVSQRILAEQLGREVENITIYTSQGDKAIGFAERMFKSVTRMGRLSIKDLEAPGLESMGNIEGVSFVDLEESASGTGHSYFHSDPAASSDMILMVRYGLAPGAGNGRPLKSIAPGFWQIEAAYPNRHGGEK